jgi:hypothetical protein
VRGEERGQVRIEVAGALAQPFAHLFDEVRRGHGAEGVVGNDVDVGDADE